MAGRSGTKATGHPSLTSPSSRPLGVTLLFTTLFAGLAGFGFWYIHVYQKSSPFAQFFSAQVKSGILTDGTTPLKREWTGHEGTDEVLTMLVLFFSPGTYERGANGVSGRAVRVQQAQLLLQLTSVLVLQMVEGYRGGNRWTLLSFHSIWAFFYQTMSGMFIFPVWYAVYTLLSHKSSYFSFSSKLAVSLPFAKALLPALLVLYVVPTVAMYIPYADPITNQDATAFWQPAPAYVNAALWLLALTVFRGGHESKTPAAVSSLSTRHINRAYGLAFIVGVITHISVVWLIMTSADPGMSFLKVFIPAIDLHTVVDGEAAAGVVFGTLRMFQWDHLGIFTSTVLWAVLGVYDVQTRLASTGQNEGVVVPVLVLLAGVFVLGPGAALAAFGVWREKKIASAAAGLLNDDEGKKLQ